MIVAIRPGSKKYLPIIYMDDMKAQLERRKPPGDFCFVGNTVRATHYNRMTTTYQPIENYGIIDDLNTVALVGLNGSIDFNYKSVHI